MAGDAESDEGLSGGAEKYITRKTAEQNAIIIYSQGGKRDSILVSKLNKLIKNEF